MKISIITVFPEIYESFLNISLIAKAVKAGLLEFNVVRFSDICVPKKRIDEPTCGPGTGMIIKPEIVQNAIDICQDKWGEGFKIFFSPQGKKLDQRLLRDFSKKISKFYFEDSKDIKLKKSDKNLNHLILVCSRYEGMDARAEKYYADAIFSIGDYVLMGGDLPAQVFLEGFLRLLPGIVGKMESVQAESFSGSFLDYPEYGLPVEWKNEKIPDVIRSGNHAQIEQWRAEKAAEKTVLNRFDWFVKSDPSQKDIDLAKKFIPNHYVVLMHNQVIVKDNEVGNTSITSLDIHDIARACATYGINNYFIVTQLKDQQKILGTFLKFWYSDEGKRYNLNRFQAVEKIIIADSLNDVIAKIKDKEGIAPLIISTSAKKIGDEKPVIIDYFSQGLVWEQRKPVLIVLGTGKGLCEQVLKNSDYLLLPIKGMTDYNHLSVRSATAVILDRWLGLNIKNYN